VTITSAAPPGAHPDALPLLDLRDRAGILQLCATCTFTFAHINIDNENVVGTGGGMSAFCGERGSRVVRIGGVGVRTACTDTPSGLKSLNATQRSPLFPEPLGQQRAGAVDAVTFRVSSCGRALCARPDSCLCVVHLSGV
jgi:hypothetical protein